MKIAIKRKEETTLPIGLHAATITSIGYKRKANGDLVLQNFEGQEYPVIRIRFAVGDEAVIEEFSTAPKSQWIWDTLSKAIRINNEKESISAQEAIGKKLWIIIAGEAIIQNDGSLKRNADGSIYFQKKMRLKFFEYINDEMRPGFVGDPSKNNGIPSGIFLINEGLDLKQYQPKTPVEKDEF